jgi:hypothetical protein
MSGIFCRFHWESQEGKVGISGGFVFDCGFVSNLTERPRTQNSENPSKNLEIPNHRSILQQMAH